MWFCYIHEGDEFQVFLRHICDANIMLLKGYWSSQSANFITKIGRSSRKPWYNLKRYGSCICVTSQQLYLFVAFMSSVAVNRQLELHLPLQKAIYFPNKSSIVPPHIILICLLIRLSTTLECFLMHINPFKISNKHIKFNYWT